VLIEGVNVAKRLLSEFVDLSGVGVDRAPDTYLFLLDALSLIGLLKFPDLINVANSSSDLVFVLKEWVFTFILDSLSDIVT